LTLKRLFWGKGSVSPKPVRLDWGKLLYRLDKQRGNVVGKNQPEDRRTETDEEPCGGKKNCHTY